MARRSKPVPTSTGGLKFEYFGYDLDKIRKRWKKIPTYQEALAYLLRCETDIEHMDRIDLLPIMERNSDSFRRRCQDMADEGFHPERVFSTAPSPIAPEHVRSCFLFMLGGQIDELRADALAGKKELEAYRRLNWMGTLDELKAVFDYLATNNLIEVKNDFRVMIQELCLHDGQEISINSLRSATSTTAKDTIYARRQEEVSTRLALTRGKPS